MRSAARSAVLLAIAGLSVIALVGFALSAGFNAHAQAAATIQVGDFWFCDSSFENGVCETTVNAGETVEWQWVGSAPHTTTACSGSDFTTCNATQGWDSADFSQTSGTFSYSFGPEDAGKTFLYRCQIHPVQMRGAITVLAAEPTPTPTPPPTPVPTPEPSPHVLSEESTPSPQPTPQPSPHVLSAESTPSAGPAPVHVQPAAVPAGGGEPPAGGGSFLLWWLAVGTGAFLVASGAALMLRRLRAAR